MDVRLGHLGEFRNRNLSAYPAVTTGPSSLGEVMTDSAFSRGIEFPAVEPQS